MPGPRHQAHCVARRNHRERVARAAGAAAAPPIQLDHGDSLAYSGNGRLKVVPVREFSAEVPFELRDGKHSYEDAPNPINQLGAVIEGTVPVSTSNDFASIMAAFNKRCNTKATFIKHGSDDIDCDVYNECCDIIDGLPDLFTNEHWDENDLDRNRWLAKFDDAKRKRMEKAFDDQVAWAEPNYIGTKDLSVKQEILIKRDDPTWAPRIIYAGNDCYNAITGPAAMVAMERLIALTEQSPIGEVNIKYAYKSSDVKLCQFLMADPTLTEHVEGDYSANDKNQKFSVLSLYQKLLDKVNMAKWYSRLLSDIQRFKVQNKNFGIIAHLANQLPTGCTETTVRNSWYNSLMFSVACRRQRRRGRALILGDDLLAALNRRFDLEKWVGDVAKFKMVLKAKAPNLEGEATFLSRRFITDTETPCMIPLIGKMLARFNCRGTQNQACSDSQYMAGKALSYAYECRHVPWMRDYFLRRHEMEDQAAVTLDDLTWFARTSGVDLQNIVQAIRDEPVLVDQDTFECWVISFYGATLYELGQLMDDIILNAEQVVLDLPLFEYFKRDC